MTLPDPAGTPQADQNHQSVPRDDRPAPIQLHDGIVVPGVLCAELAAALELYAAFLRGTPPPASVTTPKLSRPVRAVAQASKAAAVRYQAQHHAQRAWAAPTPPPPQVLGPAQPGPGSDVTELTTAQAADLAGYSPEWWRRLAVRGTIRARQAERRTWLLLKADVVGYATRAQQETRNDHHDEDGTGPRHQAA